VTGIVEFLTAQLDRDERTTTTGQCRCGSGPARPDCPDRVLADVAAKRRLLAYIGSRDVDYGQAMVMWRLLALSYADHPDCREEWRP
jgi:hypothetical protein